MNKNRKIILAMITALLAYIGSYLILSVQGHYVPCTWGAGFVKSYWWAPRGFVSGPAGIQQRFVLVIGFLPLWVIDYKLVHNKPFTDMHSVNMTLDDELRKWAERWKQNHPAEPTRARDGARGSP